MTVIRAIPEVFLSVPNRTLVTLITLDVPVGTSSSGFLDYLLEVYDGTLIQAEIGKVLLLSINNGGSIQAASTRINAHQLNPFGTSIEVTWTLEATNPGLVQIYVDSSLSPVSGYPRLTFNLASLSRNEVRV